MATKIGVAGGAPCNSRGKAPAPSAFFPGTRLAIEDAIGALAVDAIWVESEEGCTPEITGAMVAREDEPSFRPATEGELETIREALRSDRLSEKVRREIRRRRAQAEYDAATAWEG